MFFVALILGETNSDLARRQDRAVFEELEEVTEALGDLGLKRRQDGAVSRKLKEVAKALADLGLRRRNKTLLSLFHIRFGLGQRIPTFAIVS